MGFEMEAGDQRFARAHRVLDSHVRRRVTPGAVGAVVEGDRVTWRVSAGRHTYEARARAARPEDLFDLASLTKGVTATLCLLLEAEE